MRIETENSLVEKLLQIKPSLRQIKWQETEFYGFIHFSVNTFTGNQWGDGTESPALFSPSELDAEQWVKSFAEAGMGGLILTCKHHDGFCLWPSRYTDHSVKSSPWKDGQGDVVKEVAEACKKYKLKFGIYLSPWDRHEASYGDSPEYNDYFVNQLEELLTQYGEVFSVWLDGACGEGPNGSFQEYDWNRYYNTIRKYQPEAVISVCGPDVRWCGNESGQTRKEEWSVVSKSLTDAEKVQSESQQSHDHREFINKIKSTDDNLGSRDVMKKEKELVWYPSEVDVSIRPSWFYDSSEDDKVKSADELMDLYDKSVGGNSTLLLNVPPDKRGLINEIDRDVLSAFGRRLKKRFEHNLLDEAVITDQTQTHDLTYLTKEFKLSEHYHKEETLSAHYDYITIEFEHTVNVDTFVIKENILESQRIEKFMLEVFDDNKWKAVFEGATVGYKKIAAFPSVEGSVFRVRILESRLIPHVSFLGFYSSE